MTHVALIKFAPLHTLERRNDPRWTRPGRTLYEPGALKFLPSVSEIPLLVDHDYSRRVGTVHELFRMEWIDGPWICARATVDDPPAWLRKHDTKASFEHRTYDRSTFYPDLIRRALVSEVSILSPSVKPREPLAQVVHLRESVAAPPPIAARPVPMRIPSRQQERAQNSRRRHEAETAELWRRVDAAGPNADFEATLVQLQWELRGGRGFRPTWLAA
jgi:hypothetical protein